MEPEEATTEDQAGEPKIEQPLRKEQKLEMIGALAGFIAHDLNNELTVILGNVGLSLDALESNDQLYEGLVEAQRACYRCVEMTRALLNMNQSLKPELKPIGLDQLLKGTERILRKVLPTTVPTKFSKHTRVPVIMADATQLQQVIMNLAANASRAMPEESLLQVEARNGPKYVTVTIEVSSVGHTEENPKRLFVPLSSANQEAGTFGLGRDIEIVRAHRGSIDMARDANSIAFRVSLPSMSRLDQSAGKTKALTEGSACVLIADDEGPVRRAAVQILLRKGYNVMEAGDGEEAVRIFTENVDAIELVFLDMMMPGLTGLEALDQMRKIRPGLKAVVASGYPLDIADATFLAKPYSPLDLVRRIQEALTANDHPAGEGKRA
jgi:two-component system cell cycle sensor histidine kinase/response regulator CckA